MSSSFSVVVTVVFTVVLNDAPHACVRVRALVCKCVVDHLRYCSRKSSVYTLAAVVFFSIFLLLLSIIIREIDNCQANVEMFVCVCAFTVEVSSQLTAKLRMLIELLNNGNRRTNDE